jgi:hypothetical protein
VANAANKNYGGLKKYTFDNYDASKFILGHMDYQPKQDLILEFIHFD